MDLELTVEQRAVVETTRTFVRARAGTRTRTRSSGSACSTRPVAAPARDQRQAPRPGLYAANMPEEVGGGGLDTLSTGCSWNASSAGPATRCRCSPSTGPVNGSCWPARATSASGTCCRPSAVSGTDCLAMTEPEAGSDLRGMTHPGGTRRRRLTSSTGTKHFISHADAADFVILFAATGESRARAPTAPATLDHRVPGRHRTPPGSTVLPRLPHCVSHRGYHQRRSWSSTAAGCRGRAVLGEDGSRLRRGRPRGWARPACTVAASCLGRARRALDLAVRHAAAPAPVRPADRARFQGSRRSSSRT